MLVIVAVVGILAAIAIPQLTSIQSSTAETAARDSVERLNRAASQYSQSIAPITIAPGEGSQDELAVTSLLQQRHDTIPGTPFLSPSLAFSADSSVDSLRAQWNGTHFTLLTPGQEGAGLNLRPATQSPPQ